MAVNELAKQVLKKTYVIINDTFINRMYSNLPLY